METPNRLSQNADTIDVEGINQILKKEWYWTMIDKIERWEKTYIRTDSYERLRLWEGGKIKTVKLWDKEVGVADISEDWKRVYCITKEGKGLWRLRLWEGGKIKTVKLWDQEVGVADTSDDWKKVECRTLEGKWLWRLMLWEGGKIKTVKLWDQEVLVADISDDWKKEYCITKEGEELWRLMLWEGREIKSVEKGVYIFVVTDDGSLSVFTADSLTPVDIQIFNKKTVEEVKEQLWIWEVQKVQNTTSWSILDILMKKINPSRKKK